MYLGEWKYTILDPGYIRPFQLQSDEITLWLLSDNYNSIAGCPVSHTKVNRDG